jgi:hypothetical protein
VVDISVLAKSNMGRREYKISKLDICHSNFLIPIPMPFFSDKIRMCSVLGCEGMEWNHSILLSRDHSIPVFGLDKKLSWNRSIPVFSFGMG